MKTALLALMLASGAAAAQPADSLAGSITVYSHDGHTVALDDIVRAAANADVVFLGEIHDDSLGHVVQLHLLRALQARYGAERQLVMGMEMFETDVQPVLDEYAAGLIREQDMLAATRPWGNYKRDYRPLVEFSIANGIPVWGTNAPKRYVSRVTSTGGIDVLSTFSPEARATMPNPVVPPSEPLAAKFRALMGSMGSHGSMPGMPSIDGMLASQNLRDATMAETMVHAMRQVEAPLAIHVNGSFHSEASLGIPEHIARLAPEARMLVVTMRPATDDLSDVGTDDFLVLTAPAAE